MCTAVPLDGPRLGPLILTAFIDDVFFGFTSADVKRSSRQKGHFSVAITKYALLNCKRLVRVGKRNMSLVSQRRSLFNAQRTLY
jgi:hypothetical protein